LAREKGFDLLIEAAGILMAEGMDFELWIAGEGEERANLAKLVARTGRPERIRLLGFQSDLKSLFEAFDIFCLSSRREGLPNVLLEAMAMEVPAVATLAGGVAAFCAGRDDVLTVPVNDVRALAEGLRQMLRNPGLRHNLAAAARRRVTQECGFRARARRMALIYDELEAVRD
jgi:glycosyltransferase involved in cell wall biosynthesis